MGLRRCKGVCTHYVLITVRLMICTWPQYDTCPFLPGLFRWGWNTPIWLAKKIFFNPKQDSIFDSLVLRCSMHMSVAPGPSEKMSCHHTYRGGQEDPLLYPFSVVNCTSVSTAIGSCEPPLATEPCSPATVNAAWYSYPGEWERR